MMCNKLWAKRALPSVQTRPHLCCQVGDHTFCRLQSMICRMKDLSNPALLQTGLPITDNDSES